MIGEKQEYWNLPPYSYELFLIYNMLFNSSMFKRVDFDRVGGYTEGNRLEDWDLWIKILKGGGKVSLVGWGTWSVSNRAARTGRNPQTGATIQIAAKNVVKFKAGAGLSDAVNSTNKS